MHHPKLAEDLVFKDFEYLARRLKQHPDAAGFADVNQEVQTALFLPLQENFIPLF